MKRILTIVRTPTYVTKVPAARCWAGVLLALLAALLFLPRANAQGPSAPVGEPGPDEHGAAKALYLQLSSTHLDPDRVFAVRNASLVRSSIQITLDDGTIAFTKDVLGRITGAFFVGDGEVLLAPPNEVERRSMTVFTGMAILEERFSSAYFRFNDNTPAELQPGLRAPLDAQDFVAQWDNTAVRLAQGDVMRLLATFSEMLPNTNGTSQSPKSADPDDRMLHARLQGNTLGVFDILFDSTAGEQVEAGQARSAENGNRYYDVWTSFSIGEPPRSRVAQREIRQTLPAETESHQDPFSLRSYVIDAEVKPPKELDAAVDLQVDVIRNGSRFLAFELSRFLLVKSVKADGNEVEFIQNPAVEGTRLARSGNDMVAVILPETPRKGDKINLRFVYGGEVISEAGKGLLYVGARGTWYPNRGMEMADFDLTFRYPAGWTLLATGKPRALAPSQPAPRTADEQVSRWVSERPIPVAGFNLGKYVRGVAQAGNVAVEAFATSGVERDFPEPPMPAIQISPKPSPSVPQIPSVLLPSPAPSPARNAGAVAESTARAIQYYAERFGSFPYSQLALTQMPGPESQGWPGLVFLSSYAFLNRGERENLHMSPVNALLDELIPAHEAAHQWWGDLITWSTYRDQWFSEGLASYCSLVMLQEKNPAGFRLIMEKYRQDLTDKDKAGSALKDAGPVTLGSRLLSSHFPQGYEAISYGRATWLFHMLRTMLQDASANGGARESNRKPGEEPFVRSLRKLRERYGGKAVTTRELLGVFSEDLPPSLQYEGKDSLDWFLDGWVNGTYVPRLELQGVKFAAKVNSTVVTGTIRQKEAPADLVTSVPIYAAAAAGNVPVLLGRVFADGAESSFSISAPLGTHKILLDPNGAVLTAK